MEPTAEIPAEIEADAGLSRIGARAATDGDEIVISSDFLACIGAHEPVVRLDVVAQARARLAGHDHPSAAEVADSLVIDLVASRMPDPMR
jgi:hypothetical protein